jgi:DNA-binding transcriptional regulator PaaX
MSRFDAAGLIAALKGDPTDRAADGWIRTKEVIPLIGVKTLAGVRLPIENIVKAGFAQEKRVGHNLIYRLSPKFKTWADAHEAAKELERFTAPKGWVTLTQYARKLRRTVRGIQYRIDGTDIATRIYKTPRPVPHYQRADLDRLLRKAP